MNSTRYRIANAARWANRLYSHLPEEAHEEFGELWTHLEAQVTTAEAAGDGLEVDRLIERWRRTVIAQFGEAVR